MPGTGVSIVRSIHLTWEMEEIVELIKGKVYKKAAAAPRRIHQRLAGNLYYKIRQLLDGEKCQVYFGPFDVRLPVKSKKDDKIYTVVQPDICVVCDLEKLDERGCVGAPDLVVEVLSPGNKQLELQHKYEVYEDSGVKEYWIVDPESQTLLINTLVQGNYRSSRLMTLGDTAKSAVIKGFELDLTDYFSERQWKSGVPQICIKNRFMTRKAIIPQIRHPSPTQIRAALGILPGLLR